ncbi:unnamed protein product [Caenorhabditis auriculariae]|uniref:Uncharacterized protein n=1 Tax=Caenorhabditis auriculariae TaxID=2777116 RepID=A0A8S1H0X2_9PELO|nr:unnamed protein product [Caenorhabditis auriculariae]
MTRKNGQKGFQQKTFSSARRVSETQRQQAQLNQRRGGPVVPRNAPVVARNQPVVAAVLPVRGGGAPRGGRAGAGGRGGARRSARLVARAPAAADEPAAIHFAEAVEPELVNLEEGVAVNGSVEPAEVSIISRPTPGENIASVASQKDSSENLTSSGPVIKRLKVDKGTSPFVLKCIFLSAPPRNPASLAVPNSSAMNEGNVVVQLAPNQPNLWTPPEFIFLNGRRYRLESVDVGMEEGPTDAAGADPNSSAMRTDVNSSYVVSPAASPATLAILAERAAFINAGNIVADSPAVSSQDHRAGNDVAPSPAVSSQGGRLSQASLATVSWSSRTDASSSRIDSPAVSSSTLASMAERAAFINARNTVADSPAVSSQDHRAGNDVAPSPAVSSQGGRLSQASLATVSWSSRTDASSSRIDSPAVSSSTLASMAERAAFINARNTVADSPAVSSQDHRAGNDVAPSPAVSSQGGRLSQASLATVSWSSRTDASSSRIDSPAVSSSTLASMAERAAFINARNTVADSPAVSSQDHRAGNDVAPSPAVSSQGGRLSQASLATVSWSSRTDASSSRIDSPAVSSSTLASMAERAAFINARNTVADSPAVSSQDHRAGNDVAPSPAVFSQGGRLSQASLATVPWSSRTDAITAGVNSPALSSSTLGLMTGVSPNMPRAVDLNTSELRSPHFDFSNISTVDVAIGRNMSDDRERTASSERDVSVSVTVNAYDLELDNSVGSVADGSRTAGRPSQLSLTHSIDEPTGEPTIAAEVLNHRHIEPTPDPNAPKPMPTFEVFSEREPRDFTILHNRANEIEIGTGVEELQSPGSRRRSPLNPTLGMTPTASELLHSVRLPLTSPTEHLDNSAGVETNGKRNHADGSASPPAVVGHGVGRLSSSVVSNATQDTSATASSVGMSASPSADASNDDKEDAEIGNSTDTDKAD